MLYGIETRWADGHSHRVVPISDDLDFTLLVLSKCILEESISQADPFTCLTSHLVMKESYFTGSWLDCLLP